MSRSHVAERALQVLAVGQGAFYLLSGLWPMVSIDTFQAVTGPKTDIWLVKTVAALIMVIGAVLLVGGFRRPVSPEVPLLGAGAAIALTAVDVTFVTTGLISRVYLGDAGVELALVAAWLIASRLGRKSIKTADGRG